MLFTYQMILMIHIYTRSMKTIKLAQLRNITRELLRRGYSHADIEKIWGGNWLRVMQQVQAAGI